MTIGFAVRAAALGAFAALAACSTPLTQQGGEVRVVSEQERSGCSLLRVVTTTATMGDDPRGSAMNAALNQTADAGGNGFYVLVSLRQASGDAAVSGEALKCPR